jgi:16S rRNA (adenine1518-N6/adenine1519-N6)-dimethyltransferase
MVVTVQQEVGSRLAAAAGDSDYGLLSVWTQLLFRVEPVRIVRPTCFWPEPAVTCMIVSMTRRKEVPVAGAARGVFYGLTKRAFSYRRKQMKTVLGRALQDLGRSGDQPAALLAAAGLDARARPEELGADTWAELARLVHERCPANALT